MNYADFNIWRNVWDGVGGHGSFVTSFAEAVVLADEDNRLLLNDVSKKLIAKYNLTRAPYIFDHYAADAAQEGEANG